MNITSLLKQASYQPVNRIPALALAKTLSKAGQEFKALGASLNSGDVSSTQSSFDALRKLLSSAGSIGAANSVKSEIKELGKSLTPGERAPGLPVRLPGVNFYQAGLSAVNKST